MTRRLRILNTAIVLVFLAAILTVASVIVTGVRLASADETYTWPGHIGSDWEKSYVRLGPPEVEGAVATLTFHNQPVHSKDEAIRLEHAEIVAGVHVIWNYEGGPHERITLTLPPGYIAVPWELRTREHQTEKMHIYEWEGM